jgi:hypothetical protein
MIDCPREYLSRLFQIAAGIEWTLDASLVHFSIHGQHSLAGIWQLHSPPVASLSMDDRLRIFTFT